MKINNTEILNQPTGGNIDVQVQALCGLSCLRDLRALYDRCGFPNPIGDRKFELMIQIIYACHCMYIQSTITKLIANCFSCIYVVCDESYPPDIQCLVHEISGNQNLQTCTVMLGQQSSGGSFDVQVFCGLSCLGDLRTLYNTCGVSPNPVETCEVVYIFIFFYSS